MRILSEQADRLLENCEDGDDFQILAKSWVTRQSYAKTVPVPRFPQCAHALLSGGSVDMLPPLVAFIPSPSRFALALRAFMLSATLSVANFARPCGNVSSSTASPVHTSPDLSVASKRSGPSRRKDITPSCAMGDGRILASGAALNGAVLPAARVGSAVPHLGLVAGPV